MEKTGTYKHVKVALIGDSGVGKTSIIKSFLGEDIRGVKSTIAIDNYVISKDDLKIILWDFAGQRWFSDILVNFIKGANLIILVFDLSDTRTLSNILTYWVPHIKKHKDKDALVILVGNKKDKNILNEELLMRFLDKMKKHLDFNIFLKTSALYREGIDKLFDIIFELVKSLNKLRGLKIAGI
ncbi:MAG: Rab family GTPase [Candidatus Njordarchaeia archaeon]